MLTSSWPTHEPSSRDPTTTNTFSCLGEKRRRRTSRHGLDDCFAVLRMAGRQFVHGLFPSAPEPSRAHLYQYDPVSLFGDCDPDPANATSSDQAHCAQSSCGHECDCAAAAAAAADEGAAKPPAAAAAAAAKPELPTAAPARTTSTRLKTKADFFASYPMLLNQIGTDDMACVSARDDAAPGLATMRRSGVAGRRDHPLAGVGDGDGDGVRTPMIHPMIHPLRRRHSSVMNVSYRWNISEADAIEIMMAVEAANAGQSNQ